MTLVLGATIPAAAILGLPFLLRAHSVPSLSAGDVHFVAAGLTPAVRGAWSYGLRAAFARPTRLAAVALSLGIAAGTVAVGGLVFASTAATVGPTRLASALSSVIAPYQAATLVIVALGATILAMLLLRLDTAERRSEFTVLRACGWTAGTVRRTIAMHRVAIGVLSVAVAVGVAIGVGGPLEVGSPLVLGGAAGVLVIAALLVEVHLVTRDSA